MSYRYYIAIWKTRGYALVNWRVYTIPGLHVDRVVALRPRCSIAARKSARAHDYWNKSWNRADKLLPSCFLAAFDVGKWPKLAWTVEDLEDVGLGLATWNM